MNDADYFKVLGPLAFRAAEKLFKFTSWAIIISVIRYAKAVTGSNALSWLDGFATIAFSFALLMQALYLFVRDPNDWKIPPHLHLFSRIVQFIFASFLMVVCSTPFLLLDKIIADLQNAKPHEIIAKPQ